MNIKIGIIGASGYWGRKILKAISSLSNAEVLICSGYSNLKRLNEVIESSYPLSLSKPQKTLNHREIIHSPVIDAVIISTPAEKHFSIACEALREGKHVCLGKPMCLRVDNAHELAQLAKYKDRILFFDHTYLHSKCIHFIKDKIDSYEIGKNIYYHSHRTQIGIYRSFSVLWDLGPHDLSI